MSHPFHPLRGQEFDLLDYRSAWGEDRVYYYDAEGRLQRLPARWTDAVPPELIVTLGEGRSPFRADDLLRLADLIRQLERSPPTRVPNTAIFLTYVISFLMAGGFLWHEMGVLASAVDCTRRKI